MTSVKSTITGTAELFLSLFRRTTLLMFAVFATLLVLPVPFDWMSHALDGPRNWRNILFFTHVAFAVPPILVGPFLFSGRLRNRFRTGHGRMGKLYIAGCMASGITVLPVALTRDDHWVPQVGFSVMAVVWIATTFLAWRTAVNKNFVDHRRWAMRTYALTVAFIHVNLTFRIFVYAYVGDLTEKVFQSILSWNMNLIIVELWLAATTYTGKRVGKDKFLSNLRRVYRTAGPRRTPAPTLPVQEPVPIGSR